MSERCRETAEVMAPSSDEDTLAPPLSRADHKAEYSYKEKQCYPIDNYLGSAFPLVYLEVLNFGFIVAAKLWRGKSYGIRRIYGVDTAMRKVP